MMATPLEEGVSAKSVQSDSPLMKSWKSTFIGELVMERLKDLDEVAYVRFASVYRQFTDINTFISEIENLLGNKRRH